MTPGRSNNLRALHVPEVEPYITRVQLAQLTAVSTTTVDRWVREGMPSELWGRRTRRFKASLAMAWLREHRIAA